MCPDAHLFPPVSLQKQPRLCGSMPASAFKGGGQWGMGERGSPDALVRLLRSRQPHCRLFRVLFHYLPLRDSPNDDPELELQLTAGQLIFVHGQMDENQFFHGETLNGKRGLVPSNYVEHLNELQLLQNAPRAQSPSFAMAMPPRQALTGRRGLVSSNYVEQLNDLQLHQNTPRAQSPSFALAMPPHHAEIPHDFTVNCPSVPLTLPDSVCPYPPVEVGNVSVQEIKQTDIPRVPFPRELAVDKKMSRSVLVSWSAPDDSLTPISQYHVCVDGVVRSVVPGSFKCRSLIEDLPLDRYVNLSVRSVSDNGHSPDAACTIAIGLEAPVAPQHVRVWAISPVGCYVGWYPSNSNAEHVLQLNGLKVGVCPPAVFQVQLTGLSPSTIYRVSVRTKHPRAVLEQRPVERCVDFKTLPKIGLPEPPTNVQVEPGPQPGSLLISWTPVSSQPRPPSRAAVHSYLIYADGRNIAQVPTPSADHVLLRLADFDDDPPIFITVRTRTREGAVSADSNVVRVPRAPTSFPPLVVSSAAVSPRLPATLFPTGDNRLLLSTTGAPATAFTTPPISGILNAYQAPRRSNNSYPIASEMISDGTMANTNTFLKDFRLGDQYYTFHPRLLRKEFGMEEKPSVLEMEQNYLLRHRRQQQQQHQQQWFSASTASALSPATRNRLQSYTRAHRSSSADDPLPPRFATRPKPPIRTARRSRPELCSTRSEPDLRPVFQMDDESCRWFVALFDYDHLMSPNANAMHDELYFRKHQLIKVVGDVDADGFYYGQIGKRSGYVPSNMVIEIAKEDILGADRTAELTLRRTRWGSLKSRSYDHAGDRRQSVYRNTDATVGMGRRDHSLPTRPDIDYPASRKYSDFESSRRMDYDYSSDSYSKHAQGQDESRPYETRNQREWDRDRDHLRDRREREPHPSGPRRFDRVETVERDQRERSSDIRAEAPREGRREEERRSEYRTEPSRAVQQSEYRTEPGRAVQAEYRTEPGRAVQQAEYRTEPGRAVQQAEYRTEPGRTVQQAEYRSDLRDQFFDETLEYRDEPRRSVPEQQQQQQQQPMEWAREVVEESRRDDDRYTRANGDSNQQTRKLIAKFDYDSRQLSPNVDAEQVELSFRQGDTITVYGEMDEDGFYVGELNGIRGLVPSNFLQSSPLTSLLPPTAPMTPATPMTMTETPRTKGVVFNTDPKKIMPPRQTSQTKPPTTPQTAKPKTSTVTAPSKPVSSSSKKPSTTDAKPATRKVSQATKNPPGKKK